MAKSEQVNTLNRVLWLLTKLQQHKEMSTNPFDDIDDEILSTLLFDVEQLVEESQSDTDTVKAYQIDDRLKFKQEYFAWIMNQVSELKDSNQELPE